MLVIKKHVYLIEIMKLLQSNNNVLKGKTIKN